MEEVSIKTNLKSQNSFSNNNFINHETVPYPIQRLTKISIINSPNNEIVPIYIPSIENETFYSYLNCNHGQILESGNISQRLIEYVKNYLSRSYLFSIEKRIEYCYEKNNEISGNVSFVLIMPNEFKEKPSIANYLKMFKNIRKEVKQNLNTDIFLTNPFTSKSPNNIMNSKLNSENKRVLNKWGSSYGNIEDLINEENKIYKENQNNNNRKREKSYKIILEKIFVNHLTDFRHEILKECILNNSHFQDENFEMFVFYLETFINLFSGINTKYYIDELGCLNMDFYCSEENIMNIAEIMHYQLQYRIMNISKEIHESDVKEHKEKENKDEYTLLLTNDSIDDELQKLNCKKFEELEINEISHFPPYTNYSCQNSHFFRRYDRDNNFHVCNECNNKKSSDGVCELTCSSLFRNIDKTRLIYGMLSSLISIPLIKNPTKDLVLQINEVFKFILILRDYKGLLKFTEIDNLIKSYVMPIEHVDARRLNNIFRNEFGEDLGFYFFWITHYIQWLIFPAVLGLILYLIGNFLSWMTDSFIYMYFNLFFAGVVMLWANFYLTSWKSKEKFYSCIWGMENFKREKSNEIINLPGIKIQFMGVKLPVIKYFDYFTKQIISAIVILFCLIITLAFNMLIIEYQIIFNLGITATYWQYITPILTFIIREWMSGQYKSIAIRLSNQELHLTNDDYHSSLKKKILFFEFFNYYFNLYYIAFFKRNIDYCPNNDCYSLLATQLTGLLISAIVIDSTKVFWSAVYKRNKTKEFENNIKSNNLNLNNSSSKFVYYTRSEYESSDTTGEYLEIILNYGYIIQFGSASPISFFIALLQTIFLRLSDAVKFSHLLYFRYFSESHGIGAFQTVLRLLTFLGLLTNVCIIFFTNTIILNIDFSYKIVLLIIVENSVLVIMMLINYKDLPLWFKFKDTIEANYLKRYDYNFKDVMGN